MTSILLALSMLFACEAISYDRFDTSHEDYEVNEPVQGNPGNEDVGGGNQDTPSTGVLAVPADRFLASIGVNSSLNARGENRAKTLECMKYLGATWIRCGYGDDSQETFQFLIDGMPNMKFSMSVGTGGTINDFDKYLRIGRFLKNKGALIAMEGANEPNNWGITYKGKFGGTWDGSWIPIAELHRDFYAAVKADEVLKDVDVWTITCAGAQNENVGLQFLTIPPGAGCVMPAGTTYADVVNVHNYFSHPGGFRAPQNNQTWVASDPSSACKVDGLYGNNGSTWRNHYRGYSDEDCMKVRKVTTETGILIDGAVTEHMQGLMYMSCYLAQFKRGWEYTSMYILRDRSDEAGNQTFGFYTTAYEPRKAAVYLHNLTTVLKDETPIENPGRVDYTVQGKSEFVHDLLLQKNDGTFALVVWGEHYVSGRTDVVVKLGKEYSDVKVYNPVTGLEPVQSFDAAQEVSLTLIDQPYVILFK